MVLPDNNPAGNTFTINEEEIVRDGQPFSQIDDKNINDGVIINNGSFSNYNSIDNNGSFINNSSFRHLNNTFNNAGSLINEGFSRNTDNWINSGSIINNGDFFYSGFSGQSFKNTGTITSSGSLSFGEGTTNESGGLIVNEATGTLRLASDFTNNANLINNGNIDRFTVLNNGTITNNGSITTRFSFTQNYGVIENNGDFCLELGSFGNFGTIVNNGTFLSKGDFFASGNFSGNPLNVTNSIFRPQGLILDTDFVQSGGTFAVLSSFGFNGTLRSAFADNQPLLKVSGDAEINGGTLTVNSNLANLDFGTYSIIDLTNGTLTIEESILANAQNTANGFDTEDKDFELFQQGNDLVLTVEECFLTGTNILTTEGYKKVENLKIGDKVKTADGNIEDIKWIGYQTRHPSKIRNPLRSYPILIKAGAFGNGLPLRDLYTSPDHAYLFEGLLINAGALVNDVSIIKIEPTETFTYYHVELENHALLVAEGTAAESYLPQKENRAEYDNGAEYEQLYPHGSNLMLWPMDYPRISSRNKVPHYISQKLMQIGTELHSTEVFKTA